MGCAGRAARGASCARFPSRSVVRLRFPSPVRGGDVAKPRSFRPVSVLPEVTGRGRGLGMNGRSRAPVVGPDLRHPRPAAPRTLALSPMAPAPRPRSPVRVRHPSPHPVCPSGGLTRRCSPRRLLGVLVAATVVFGLFSPAPVAVAVAADTATATATASNRLRRAVQCLRRAVGRRGRPAVADQHAGSRWSSSTGSPVTRVRPDHRHERLPAQRLVQRPPLRLRVRLLWRHHHQHPGPRRSRRQRDCSRDVFTGRVHGRRGAAGRLTRASPRSGWGRCGCRCRR